MTDKVEWPETRLDAISMSPNELWRAGLDALDAERAKLAEVQEVLCSLPVWQPVRNEFWREAASSVSAKLKENAAQIVDLLRRAESAEFRVAELEDLQHRAAGEIVAVLAQTDARLAELEDFARRAVKVVQMADYDPDWPTEYEALLAEAAAKGIAQKEGA